jgi:hypothetical protein
MREERSAGGLAQGRQEESETRQDNRTEVMSCIDFV